MAIPLFGPSARHMARTFTTGLVAMLAWLAASPEATANPGGRNSAATITAAFTDSCRAFVAQSSKDISHVELHYVDGRTVKDESIGGPEYAIEGGAGDELALAIVKSGITSRQFECIRSSGAPVALLEIRTPAGQDFGGCFDFFAGGLMCNQLTPRVEWTSADQVPDAGGSDSGLFHWGCGLPPDYYAPCSFTVGFRGIGSSDPDGDITLWSLDFGDGTSAGGSWTTDPPAEVAHAYSSAGCDICVITLTVTDSAGRSNSVSMRMVFMDLSPG